MGVKGLFVVQVSPLLPTRSTRTQGGHVSSLSWQQSTESVASEPNAGDSALLPAPTTESTGGAMAPAPASSRAPWTKKRTADRVAAMFRAAHAGQPSCVSACAVSG